MLTTKDKSCTLLQIMKHNGQTQNYTEEEEEEEEEEAKLTCAMNPLMTRWKVDPL
jgi:hypothetical protein